jgi:hypothetical protein
MPTLPTETTDFLTRIKDSLRDGSALGSNVRGAALNYLRAQDMATVLELLQNGLDTAASAGTATGGSATTVVDGGAPFTADREIGNVVVFDGNVTAALAGAEARVVANDTTTLTFGETLPGTPAAGDTFSIRGGFMDTVISELREGRGLGDAPRGSVYGETRNVQDALLSVMVRLRESLDATLSVPNGTDSIDVTFDTYAGTSGSAGNDVGVEFVVPTTGHPVALAAALNAPRRTLVVTLGTDGGGALDAGNTTTAIAAVIDATGEFASASAGTEVATADLADQTPHGPGRYVFSGGTSAGDHNLQAQPGAVGDNTIQSATQVAGRDVIEVPADPALDTYSQVELDLKGSTPPSADFFKGRVLAIPGFDNRKIISSNGAQVLFVPRFDEGLSPAALPYVLLYTDNAEGPHNTTNAHPGGQAGGNARLAELIELAEETIANLTLAY